MSNGISDSYVVLRNRTFHYRRRVPADVQALTRVRWWKKSLKTGAKREAESRARRLAAEHDELIARARGLPLNEQHTTLSSVLDETRDEILADPDDSLAREDHERAAKAAEKIKRSMLAAAEQRLDTLPEDERNAIEQLGGLEAFVSGVRDFATSVAFDKATVSINKAFGAKPERVAEAQAVVELRSQRLARKQRTLAKLGLQADDDTPENPNDPRLKTAMVRWFEERKQGVEAIKRHKVSINRFAELHGNLPVSAITKLMVKEYVKAIENLPDHRKLPTKKRGGLADPDTGLPRVSAPTVERHLISIKALLKFCEEQDWVTSNVASGLRAPKDIRPKASKRRSFTREERNQVLERAIEESGSNGDIAWLIKLAAYTGCRLEELAQLARTNVREIDGVWVIEIDDLDGRHLKTQESVKVIPLHPAIRDDFVAWVNSGTGTRVFPSFRTDRNGRYANELSGDFGRLMDRAGLTDSRLVFHSFRHTLKREMSNARIDPDVRRLILGHAPKDAHEGYDGHSLEAVADELAKLPPMFD